MKLVVEKDSLAKALLTASRAVAARGGVMAVLSGVHIKSVEGGVEVVGTDLETTITVRLDCEADGFNVVAPAKVLTDVVKALPNGRVALEASPDELTVTAGAFESMIRLLPVDEWPTLPVASGDTVTVDGAGFADALSQTVPAASTDEARPILTGLHVETVEDGVRLVATDSYRLAYRDLPGINLSTDEAVLVPASALREVVRAIDGSDVHVGFGDRTATFTVGDTVVSTRLIEGQYPNYRGLLPGPLPNRLTVDVDAMSDVVKRVSLMARDPNTPIKLVMSPGSVQVTAVTQGVGDASETVDATYEGESLTVGFNPTYLLDGLGMAGADTVEIGFTDSAKPSVLSGVDGWLYLLMPVRIS